MKILIDTNLFLRLAQRHHPHHSAASRAIEILRTRGDELCVVPQVLYEYWVVYTRPLGENGLGRSTAEAAAELTRIQRLFTFFRDERAVFPAWERIVAQHDVKGRNAHDARLAAAMARHGLTHLLTFNDSDFARFAHVTTLTPQQIAQTSS
jgi:predicted nucleic acid-binding protein